MAWHLCTSLLLVLPHLLSFINFIFFSAPLFCEFFESIGVNFPHCFHFLYMGVLLVHGLYWTLAVSLYPFLGCHFSKRHIHSYFVHIMHEFLFPPAVLVNWLSYFFPPNFLSRCSTPFPEYALLDMVLVFLRSLVSAYLAPAIFHLCLLIHIGRLCQFGILLPV